jgi:pimeloyl-ACP methyl ester carboxylesterase
MNLLDQIEHERAHRDALVAAWLRYARRTWGRPEMKARDRFVAVAEQLAVEVPAPVRELFLIGVGARPGGQELAEAALRRFDAAPLDPAHHLDKVRCRVDLVHGVEDDVIPYEQSLLLASRLVNAEVHTHLTGLYGHTGARRGAGGSLVSELATMARVLRALAA